MQWNGQNVSIEARKIAQKVVAMTGHDILPDALGVPEELRRLLRDYYVATGGKRGGKYPEPSSRELKRVYNGQVKAEVVLRSLLKQKGVATTEPTAEAPKVATVIETRAPTEEERKLEALRDLIGGGKVDPAEIEAIVDRRIAPLEGKLTASLPTLVADAVADAVRTVEIVIPNMPPVTITNPHQCFERLLRYVVNREHVMIVGAMGSGKSSAAEMVAPLAGLPFYMTGTVNEKEELLGYKGPTGTYYRSLFRDAFENGGLFCADEADGYDPAAFLAVNAHTAAKPGSWANFPDGMVQRHPDFVFVATGNTWGMGADREYVGRNQLDGACRDRMAFLPFDIDEQLELAISPNRDWTLRVQQIRAAVYRLKEKVSVSPRASIKGGKMLAAGDTVAQVEDAYIFRGCDANVKHRILAEVR